MIAGNTPHTFESLSSKCFCAIEGYNAALLSIKMMYMYLYAQGSDEADYSPEPPTLNPATVTLQETRIEVTENGAATTSPRNESHSTLSRHVRSC